MTDQIPPTTPPQLQLSTQKTTPLPPAGPVVEVKAPVREAPERLNKPEKPVRVEGRVVESNTQTKEVRIATPEGEIVVQSDVPLPPDTEVSVDLYTQKGRTLATIALLQKQDEAVKELLKTIQPSPFAETPPLKEGDKIIALKLPEDIPQTEPEFVELTLKDVAKITEQVKAAGIEKFPLKLPLPPEAVIALFKSQDIEAALQKLPAEQQEKIIEFIKQPPVIQYLKETLNIVIPAQAGIHETEAAKISIPSTATQSMNTPLMDPRLREGDTGGLIDNNLLNIIKAQISAKITQDVIAGPKTTPAMSVPHDIPQKPGLAILSALLPFIENLESVTEPLPAYIRQFMPADAMAHLKQADTALNQTFFQFTIQKIIPPGTPAPPQPQPGQQKGVVETVTPRGFPIIRTESNGVTAHFVFRAPVQAQPATTVIFDFKPMTIEQVMAQPLALLPQPLADAPPPLSYNPAAAAKPFEPLLSTTWPALQEALQVMAGAAQSPAAAALRNTLPAPTPKLVPTALFFLAALRLGNIESWLGATALQALKDSGKRDLVEKLAGDFGRISAQSKETVAGDWRMISMPLLHDDQLSQLQFYVRRQQDENSKEDGEAKPVTRFLLNLQLSRMGDMQLDGLLRKKQFDLILRSEDALPFNMRQDLMQAFAKGLSQAEMQGGISFQVKHDHWVKVELPKHAATIA